MALAPLDNEVVFKKLFRDPEILSAFIKDLIGIELDPNTMVIEQKKKFVPPIGGVDTEMDIFVDDPQHRLVIEIQRVWYDAHYDRFLHYWLVSMVEMVKGYLQYRLNRTVYVIVWLMQEVKEKKYQRSLITTSFYSETHKGERLSLYRHQLYCLNPFYLDEETPVGVADWMKLVMESIHNPKSPQVNLGRSIIKKAVEAIDGDGLTPQERAEAIDRREYETSLQNKYKEGQRQQMVDTARKMLLDGFDEVIVTKYTGLSLDELNTLLKAES